MNRSYNYLIYVTENLTRKSHDQKKKNSIIMKINHNTFLHLCNSHIYKTLIF